MKYTTHQLRQKYLDFMEQKAGHNIVPSAPLLPENDPTTLFTGSGMQPMVPYLLGESHPSGSRIADSQKCFRAVDINEVGDNSHTTFFEMLGNWSLGDFFKKEQISWMFEFLVEELELDPDRLFVTAFAGDKQFNVDRDNESIEMWKTLFSKKGVDSKVEENPRKNGLNNSKIFLYGTDENWWSRAGAPQKMPVGEPGGPDSEMFWDFGADLKLHENSIYKDDQCHPNCDCGRFLEIGNNVFMEFQKTKDGIKPLKNKNVDFGGGLERIAVAISDVADVFQCSVFQNLREKIETISGKKYGDNPTETFAFRVIMDHLRAATFLISDGATPGNLDQNYFTRRLLRRAIRNGRKLGLNENFCVTIAQTVIDDYADYYPNLLEKSILKEIEIEETQFRKTLEKGEREIAKLLDNGNIIDGKKAFWLFETFGFPQEMTEEILLENAIKKSGIKVGENETIDSMKEKIGDFLPQNFEKDFQTATKAHSDASRIAAAGKFSGGLADHSEKTIAYHTATHLMLAGLREVLGDHVHQKGSNITEKRLRFDFNHDEKLTDEQKQAVEEYVNAGITANAKQILTKMEKEKAKAEGVEGSFWEKYPDVVKVYCFEDNTGKVWTKELCGGPHADSTGNLGIFKIKKEQSSGRGIRRIKAVLS